MEVAALSVNSLGRPVAILVGHEGVDSIRVPIGPLKQYDRVRIRVTREA